MLVAIILYLILLLVSFSIDKKIYSPRVLFFGVWFVILTMYSLKLYPLKECSFLALIVYMLSGIFFFVGAEISGRIKFTSNVIYGIFREKTKQKIFFVFFIITCIVLLRGCIEQVRAIINGVTYYEIAFGSDIAINETRGIWVPLTYFIAGPMAYAFSPIAAYEFIVNKNNKYVIANVIVVLLYTLHRGERGLIFMLLVSYLIMFLIHRRIGNRVFADKKKKKKFFTVVVIVAIVCVGVALISFYSSSRGIEDQLQTWYYYLTGTVPYLSIMLENVSSFKFGLAMLSGLLTPIMTLLNGLGILSWPTWFLNLQEAVSTATFVNISSEGSWGFNAFVGPAYYNYIDFGIIGVILGMLVFGFFCQRVYKNACISYSKKDICLYLMLVFNIVFSMERNWFFLSYYIYAFIYIWFFFRNPSKSTVIHGEAL